LGTPSFLYVAPAFFYGASLLRWWTPDVWATMRIMVLLASLLTGMVGWFGLRRWVTPGWALLGAVALQVNPFTYHTLSLHNLFPFSLVMPLLVWCGVASVEHRTRSINLSITASMALLTLTHQLAALIALVTLPFVFLPELARDRRSAFGLVWSWGLSCLLGLGLAAYQWYPAVSTQQWIESADWFEPVFNDWRNSFILPVFTAQRFGMRWAGVQWGLGGLAVLGLCLLALGWRRERPGDLAALPRITMAAAAACFFAWEGSFLIWRPLFFLQMVQWPYRFLLAAIPLVLMGLVVMASRAPPFARSPGLRILAVGLVGLFPLVSAGLQIKSLRVAEVPDFQTMRAHDYRRVRVPGGEWKAYARAGGLSAECAAKGVAFTRGADQIHSRSWTFTTGRETDLRLPLFSFPAWRVAVDNLPVETRADDKTGLLTVRLPPGRHEVSVRWVMLPQERRGLALSLCAVIMVGAIVARRTLHLAKAGRTSLACESGA
jgi:uncharacterized membrane protein